MRGELRLVLLGKPQFTLNDRRLTLDQLPVKGAALLAYLAVTRQEHSRTALAGLLWGDMPEDRARANLRLSLTKLRQHLGDYLLTSRQSIAFNVDYLHWLDLAEFEAFLATSNLQSPISSLQSALSLYRGDFLDDFQVAGAPEFEAWRLDQRERLRLLALEALDRLADLEQQAGHLLLAIETTRRLLVLEPWQEEAHRRLMALLAQTGQRSAALAQYETCRRLLAAELGVDPAPETTGLYHRIRHNNEQLTINSEQLTISNEQLTNPPPNSSTPPLLHPSSLPVFQPSHLYPLFVARERELGELATALATARAGQGQIQFVIGGAGRGKTSLVQEFARQALADDPDLVVITGNCHAHTGLGDPYLPFREALAMLTGEVEARWAGGQITRQAAHRLWALLPVTLPLLIDHAPDLIERFIPGRPLLDRAAALVSPESAWFKQLAGLVAERGRTGLEQQPLFRQTTAWLKAVAAQRPLLLILEDLHWIDSSSNALLFHLCRELWPNRVLLIGTYRPEAVALGRGEKLHPLAPILGELKRQHGDIWLDLASLSPAEGKAFVDAYLDTQPNQLSVAFRTALFRRTAGHPLFTVELLREMQARGDLRRNETGHWVEGETIDWHRLPAKVEGVIETRIAHLPDGLQSVLTIASVEGETFTAELVARVQQLDEWMIVQQMSRELEERHRLVTAQQLERVGSQRLSRYRFRHHLFQHYLYHRLAEAERVYLHEAVGWALASLYDGDTEAVAIKLAHHFEQAGLTEQATHYLLQAGRRANRLSAYQAAVDHLRRGLGLLATLPESLARHQRELDFQVALGVALMHLQGYAAPAVKEAYTRARALCEKMETTAQLFPVLYGLWAFYHVRAEHQAAREMGETWLRLAKDQADPVPLLTGHRVLGVSLLHLGQPIAARPHLEQCLALYNSEQHQTLAFLYGHDHGVAGGVLLAWTLWLLGYPDQALAHNQAALALARRLAHPFSLAFALVHAAMLHQMRREPPVARTYAEAALVVCQQHDFSFWLAAGNFLRSWSLAEAQSTEAGPASANELSLTSENTGMALWQTYFLPLLAQSRQPADQLPARLALLDRALTIATQTGEQLWAAELHRLQGELRLKAGTSAGTQTEAENWFRQALAVARQQGALSLELRAVLSLSRLWQGQGRIDEARSILAGVYSRFSEGFDTVDLREARLLLEELA